MSAVWRTLRRLTFDDGAGGASVCAGAAANACILVNLVDVALGDCSNGAFASASATGNASVGDFVSHFVSVFKVDNVLWIMD